MTLSARANTLGEIVRLICAVVFRSMTSSNSNREAAKVKVSALFSLGVLGFPIFEIATAGQSYKPAPSQT
jgi:hypothetical protein